MGMEVSSQKFVSFTVDSDPLLPTGCVDRYTSHESFFSDIFDFVHTSHCGSRCRSVCLAKITHARVITCLSV